MNSYAARTVYPCTVPYNIKLYTGLHGTLCDYRVGEGSRTKDAMDVLQPPGRPFRPYVRIN